MKRCKFMILKRLTLLFTLIFCAAQMFAQEKTITGKVIDGDNSEPLPGVNIIVENTTLGTVTDIDGNYEISVPNPDVSLVFSYIGYLSQTIPLEGKNKLDVILEPDVAALEEVVVVGYGTMKKSDLTGAVSSVDDEVIASTKSSNAVEALQGKIAGIDMVRSSGSAGSDYSILIRGARSLTASNDPIYIVDGVDYGSNININPNDIASMEVLKDASSTAIYGSRGANGVILITTKKGNSGKPVISFNTYYGRTSPLGALPNGDAEYYLRMTRDIKRTGDPDLWDVPDEEIDVTTELFNSEIVGYENGTDFDWIDAQMEDFGTQQDYHLSITGGNEKNTYAVSLNHFIEDNFIPNDDYKRYSVKSNIASKVNDFFEMGNSSFLSFSNQHRGRGINYSMIPLVTAYDSLGNLIPEPNERVPFENPLIDQDSKNRGREIYRTDIFSTFYAQLNLMPGLTFKSSYNVDLSFKRDGQYMNEYEGLDRISTASLANDNNYKWTWTNVLTLDKNLNDHHIMVTAATEAISSRTERTYQYGADMKIKNGYWHTIRDSDPAFLTIINPDKDSNLPFVEESLLSYIGRLHYGLKNKYLLTVTGRYDGASQLRDKWDFFPSASIAWKVSEESFMKGIGAISNLKLRAGYGTTGNQSSPPYSSLGSITSYSMPYEFGENPFLGYRTGSLNTYPKWEKTAATNVGIDFGLMENRISGSVEIYQATTTDVLQSVTLPPTSAVTTVIENIGETSSNGVEVTLRTVNISTSDLNWTTDFTFSRNQEEITFLAGGVDRVLSTDYNWIVGEPLDVHFNWKKIGIWQSEEEEEAGLFQAEPGDIKFEDVDGNDTINDIDRMILGTPRPKWTGGLNSTLNYKNFDLTVFVFARIGQTIRDEVIGMWAPDGRENSVERDYWTPNNPTNEWPKVDPNRTRSGWAASIPMQYVDGSFVKIKNITLGYRIPEDLTSKAKISSARLYITMNNYFAFGKYFKQGRYDPEGRGDAAMPIPKMIAVGANVNF